ncbi:hypothetical protein BURPS668_1756 [Burkholderia pseudomallei 668]|nr:hypothetical protein BURPS668_1756 [Burkholderia pseudomallei 668]
MRRVARVKKPVRMKKPASRYRRAAGFCLRRVAFAPPLAKRAAQAARSV